MPDNDTTTIKLKDGTVLTLKGNLSPDEVAAKVQQFRASQSQPQGSTQTASPLAAKPPSQPSQPAAPAEKPGFMQGLEEQSPIPFHASMIHPLDGIKYMIQHPIDSMSLVGQAMMQAKDTAITNANANMQSPSKLMQMGGGLQRALAEVPMVGPAIDTMSQHAAKGEYAAAAGGATGLLAQAAGPDIARGAANTGMDIADAVKPGSRANLTLQAHSIMDNAALDEQAKLLDATGNAHAQAGEMARGIALKDKQTAIAAQAPHPTHSLAPLYDSINQSTSTYRPSMAAAGMDTSPLNGIIQRMNELNDPARVDPTTGTSAGSHVWFDELKDLRTDIGSAMSRAQETGQPRDAAILGKLYKTSSSMMSDTADKLGMSDQYAAYNKIHSTMMNHENGVLKPLFDTDVTAAPQSGGNFIKKAQGIVNTPQWTRAAKDLSQFGYDPESMPNMLNNMSKTARFTDSVQANASTGMMGKLKAISQHPFMAMPAAAAVYELPLPQGMKFIVGMLAAGKMASFGDRIALAGEIRRLGVPPDMGSALMGGNVQQGMQKLQQWKASQVPPGGDPAGGAGANPTLPQQPQGGNLLSRIIAKVSSPADELSTQLSALKADNERLIAKQPGDMPGNGQLTPEQFAQQNTPPKPSGDGVQDE